MSKELSTNVKSLREEYTGLIKDQSDIQSRFGSSFSLRDVNDNVQKTVVDGSRAVNKLTETGVFAQVKGAISRVPVLGKLVDESYRYISDEAMRNRRIDEITDGIFKSIREKQETVFNYCSSLEEIKNKSVDSHNKIMGIIEQLKDVNADSLSVEEKNFVLEVSEQESLLRDRIVKMEATIMSASRLSNRITHLIPTLQDDLFNQLALNSTLDGIRDMNEQLNNTVEATYKIATENDKAVKATLLAVTKDINDGDGFERYNKRQEDFMKFSGELRTLVEKTQERQSKMVNHIQQNHLAQLTNMKSTMERDINMITTQSRNSYRDDNTSSDTDKSNDV